MAEVAEVLLLPIDGDDDGDDEETGEEEEGDDTGPHPRRRRSSASSFALDREIRRRWRPDHGHLDPGIFVPVFASPSPPSSSSSFLRIGRGDQPDPLSGFDSDEPDDRAVLALDLFDPGTPRRRSGIGMEPIQDGVAPLGLGVFRGMEVMGSGYRELGLGLGFGVEKLPEEEGGFDGVDSEDEGSDWGVDGLFVGRRSIALESGGGGEPSHSGDGDGLSIVRFRFDSDSDNEGEEDLGLPLCWDNLRIEEERRDSIEDFDWEEVDGRVDEREVLSMVMGASDDRSMVAEEEANAPLEIEEEVEAEDAARSIEWEVLLAANDLERNASIEQEGAESYMGEEHEGFVYTSEYEILVGQFADHEGSIKGNPPAAKSVIERLPSVVLMQMDVASNSTLCAVCKDEILMEEKAKQLPCLHHYHTECILPWLRMRNTCPVCRHELPTDDPDYENWRALRATSGRTVQDSQVRYNFEIFHEQ